jgi:hypothetical protein
MCNENVPVRARGASAAAGPSIVWSRAGSTRDVDAADWLAPALADALGAAT